MIDKIIELIDKGYTQGQVGSMLGFSRSTVQYKLRNIDRKPTIKELSIKLYNDGLSTLQIAKKLDRSISAICQHLVNVKKRGRTKKVTKDIIESEILKCSSVKEVCDNLNISTRLYYSYIKGRRFKKNIVKSNTLKDSIIKLRSEGKSVKEVTKELNISKNTVVVYSKGYSFKPVIRQKVEVKKLKTIKMKKAKQIIPAEISRDMLGKGFERGEVKAVKLREDRDAGVLVKVKYSTISDFPSKIAEVRINGSIDDGVNKWAKKLGARSWVIV